MADLSHLATSGTEIAVRVTPRASRERIEIAQDVIRVYVTAPAQDGRANDAARALLAKALGLAKSHVVLRRGQTARNKIFRIEGAE